MIIRITVVSFGLGMIVGNLISSGSIDIKVGFGFLGIGLILVGSLWPK